MKTSHPLLEPIRKVHFAIRSSVIAACERADAALHHVDRESTADTIYAIDRTGEDALIELFIRHVAPVCPITIVAEGLEADVTLPIGTNPEDATCRVIVDPIDGTRGLMYQKRSAWILTGVAGNRGPATTLADIELAVQTEIPLLKQNLADQVWAVRGNGAAGVRTNRLTGVEETLHLAPSTAANIEHGFFSVSRFFPAGRAELAAIDEEIISEALGPTPEGRAVCFEDQYISSGGQLFELMTGHDRCVMDLRATIQPLLAKRGVTRSMCSHPYDLCTELIAREAGVVVTDPQGRPLQAPLVVDDDVAWVGYANDRIRAQIEPLLLAALRRRGLI